MNYNPDKHHRRSIRLQGYDYRQAGAYYFTICSHQRQCLFGEIISGVMHPNIIGETVEAIWNNLPRHFPFIELDAFVLMPNHVHGIILITDNQFNCRGEAFGQLISDSQPESFAPNALPSPSDNPKIPHGTQSGSLGAILQNFKSVATRRVNRLTRHKVTIWQRNYYEEIIRDEKAYENIRRYIIENPLRWDDDEENPLNLKSFQQNM
jgi:putative transposase